MGRADPGIAALAAVASHMGLYPLLLLGFGICHGVGTAFAYLSTTSMLQRHYSEAKGFSAGLGVAGFGAGAVVWSAVGKQLLVTMEPWQVQAITGGSFGGLGAVLFNAGSVQLFSGKSFTPVVISDWAQLATAEPLTLRPAMVPRCGRASTPIPACTGEVPAAKDVFSYDEALVGREIQVRAQFGERATAGASGVESVWQPVLLDRDGHSLAFELAGDGRFDCNGHCCDFDGIGAKVVASGVVRKAETPGGNQYRLARARLCRLPN